MEFVRVKELLRQYYGLKSGVAFRWADGAIWGTVVFAEQKILSEKIERELSRLPKQCGDVVRLLLVEGAGIDDVAQICGCSCVRVLTLYHRALAILCKRLE